MINLVTAANAAYFEKVRPYLKTLQENGQCFKVWFVAVNAPVPDWLGEYPAITGVTINTSEFMGSPAGTESLQHGRWLQAIPATEEDEVFIFTDGDIFLQRPLSDEEIEGLETCPPGRLYASFNMGPQETLIIEALYKLHPRITDGEFLNTWGRSTITHACLNVGVMAARRSTFEKMHGHYMTFWELIGKQLEHQARQQWLIAWVAYDLDLDVQILPYTFHTHAHFNLPEGTVVGRAGDCYADGHLVAFWHVPMWARK